MSGACEWFGCPGRGTGTLPASRGGCWKRFSKEKGGADQRQVGNKVSDRHYLMVGTAGFEPATSASRTLRATNLRHVPMCWIVSVRWGHARS